MCCDTQLTWQRCTMHLKQCSQSHRHQSRALTRATCIALQDNQLIRAGQWWRLITPVALHANLLHLVTNNYSLNSLGPAVEMLSGRPRFLSVYAASAVAGSAASFAFSPAASVGASGQLPIEGLVVT